MHYRREAFAQGFAALGYAVTFGITTTPRAGDVMLSWNRYGPADKAATAFERAGLPVLIAENAYIARPGAKWYALARSHHVGAGRWAIGGPERWESLGIDLAPIRAAGEEIVVLPQRGIGPPGVAMPFEWPTTVVAYLKQRTRRPIRVRAHPGKNDKGDLLADLARAHAAVVWASGAGVKAIVGGVPVFHCFPRWIGAGASTFLRDADIEAPSRCPAARLATLHRLAWAQAHIDEIRSGEAIRRLLEMQ